MTTIEFLIITLVILMMLVGGKKGFSPIFSLILNFFLLFINVILISVGLPPLIITIFTSICILCTTIYMSNCSESEANVAFFSTLIVLFTMLILIIPLDYFTQIQGFGSEQSDEIEAFNLSIGINFEELLIATTLLSTLGAISEAAIAVASGMNEIIEQNPQIDEQEIKTSGKNIGFQILGMTFNTLFFGMFGGSLALFILLDNLKVSFGYYFNSKIFVNETFSILYSAIAVLLVIGVTIELMSRKVRGGAKTK